MIKLYTFLCIALLTSSLLAQAPQKMSYQAVIRNESNALVPNSSIGVQVSILSGSATGTSVYTERHFPTTNANGLVTIEIGSGLLISGSFATINWSIATYFIKTEIDLNGGANYTITATSQMLSVPYALHAKTAESITGSITETDPVWNAASSNYYSKTNMQTSGASLLHYGNITNRPTTLSGYGITDAVNITTDQTISGIKTFSSLPIFNNGLKFSDNTTLTTGNVGKWTFDGTNNTTQYSVTIPQGGIQIGKVLEIWDYDPNSHILQFEKVGGPFIYGRYLNGSYGNLVIQGMCSPYAGNIHFVTGSSITSDNNPPTERMLIMRNGNVGIGSFDYPVLPSTKLEVRGNVYVNDPTSGIILKSPNGLCWRVTVDNTGNLSRTQITCP